MARWVYDCRNDAFFCASIPAFAALTRSATTDGLTPELDSALRVVAEDGDARCWSSGLEPDPPPSLDAADGRVNEKMLDFSFTGGGPRRRGKNVRPMNSSKLSA